LGSALGSQSAQAVPAQDLQGFKDLLLRLLQEAKNTRQAIEDLISVLKTERPADGAPPVQVVIPPIDPDMLNNVLQTMAWRARYQHPSYRLAVAVPPGPPLTDFTFYLPEGFYCTRRVPITFESNYYSPDITVNVYVDGKGPENLVTPFGMQMYPEGATITVNFGEQWLKKRYVYMEFINNTATTATIAFEVASSQVHHTIYESWYAPIVEFTKQRLNDVARAMGGQAI
jgi:hypothetical protein